MIQWNTSLTPSSPFFSGLRQPDKNTIPNPSHFLYPGHLFTCIIFLMILTWNTVKNIYSQISNICSKISLHLQFCNWTMKSAIHLWIYIYIYMCIYIYTHTHIHTHTCMCVCVCVTFLCLLTLWRINELTSLKKEGSKQIWEKSTLWLQWTGCVLIKE